MIETKVEVQASNALAQAKKLLKTMADPQPVVKTGLHVHVVEDEAESTALDGEHFHVFTLPVSIQFQPEDGRTVEISAGTALRTEPGGVHSHRVTAGEILEDNSAHRHVIPVPGGYELFTETDGGHIHEKADGDITTPGGEHQHQLRLGDRTVASKTVKQLDPAVCSIAQVGSIEEVAVNVLSAVDTPPVIVWQAEPPSGELPALKLPDPKFIVDRLLDGKPTGLIAIVRRVHRVGQPQLLVNEVGPLRPDKAFAWAVLAQDQPRKITSLEDLSTEEKQGLDKYTRSEFTEVKNLYYLPLRLAVVFDPPLELAKPPSGRRFGSVVNFASDIVQSRQISIEEMLRDLTRRQVHNFVNDPSVSTLQRASTGHLLEIDRQLHLLFERVFAALETAQEEGVTRADIVSAHDLVMRELTRRRVATEEVDLLAKETRAIPTAVESIEIEQTIEQRTKVDSGEAEDSGKQDSIVVQSLLFNKEIFSESEAVEWALEHEFKADKVDETENNYRLRQREPSEFDENTFRTISLTEGVQAVVGFLKETAAEKIDEDELDEVYSAWEASVNMTATELREWADNPCSRLASLDPSAVIGRNLHLLETAKSKWTDKEIEAAKRTIAFIARMRGVEQGDPARKGCPSRRDISLKNWAFDPRKAGCFGTPPLSQVPVNQVTKHDVRILKSEHDLYEEQDERYVFGVVLIPDEVDAQGDTYDAPTIRRAAHSYMENGQHKKIMHDGRPVQGVTVLETYLSRSMETYGGETFPVGTWFLAVRVNNNDIWNAVKNGTFTGFSMGGTAVRESLA